MYAFDTGLQYAIIHMRHQATDTGRRVLDLGSIGIPEVPVFGSYEYSSVRAGLQEHSHLGIVEICYLERGHQTYRVGNLEYRLAGGDVFVTKPGEPHDTGGQPEERGKLYWMNLRMSQPRQSFLSLPRNDATALAHALLTLPKRSFAGSDAIKTVFDEIFQIYDEEDNQLKRICITNRIVRCILMVIECSRCLGTNRCTPVIERLVRRIESNPEEEYRLLDLADEAALSLSRFKARFRHETGLAPHDFILRSKVEAAKKLLAHEGETVTDIAMRLNFSSSQYFATVFKRFTMQTPSEFRNDGTRVPLRKI